MVIIHSAGGLGNQMFQYAAARALAIKHNTTVHIDAESFATDDLRLFDLSGLHTHFVYATPEDIQKLKAHNTKERIIARLTPYPKKRFYKQPYFHFDPKFFELPAPVYLKGYFQSEEYFAPIKTEIRKEFTIRPEHVEKVAEFGRNISSQPSVSVHIRRGDYKKEAIQKYHGILPLTYYNEAVQTMKQQVPGAKFYVFTDDKEWVVKYLNLPDAVQVSGNYSQTHFEDLYLMSCCRHNIIANSSFSWWGAWLGHPAERKVIAPKAWFGDGPKDLQDLVPQNWLRI